MCCASQLARLAYLDRLARILGLAGVNAVECLKRKRCCPSIERMRHLMLEGVSIETLYLQPSLGGLAMLRQIDHTTLDEQRHTRPDSPDVTGKRLLQHKYSRHPAYLRIIWRLFKKSQLGQLGQLRKAMESEQESADHHHIVLAGSCADAAAFRAS